jgi:hypothetical protein
LQAKSWPSSSSKVLGELQWKMLGIPVKCRSGKSDLKKKTIQQAMFQFPKLKFTSPSFIGIAPGSTSQFSI